MRKLVRVPKKVVERAEKRKEKKRKGGEFIGTDDCGQTPLDTPHLRKLDYRGGVLCLIVILFIVLPTNPANQNKQRAFDAFATPNLYRIAVDESSI